MEQTGTLPSHLAGVAPLALVVESVDAVEGGAFVVASEEEEVLRVLDLEAEEQHHRLYALLGSVHVVAQEEVIGLKKGKEG